MGTYTENELFMRALDRILATQKSAKKRRELLALYGKLENIATEPWLANDFQDFLFGEDLDAVIEHFNDDAEAIDTFVGQILEDKSIKKP